MTRSIRLVLALALLATLSIGAASTAAAGGRKVFDSTMTALPVANAVLDGLTGGGVPWVIDEGRAILYADGRLHVEVQGLIIPTQGRNPVAFGKAVVTCGDTFADDTDLVPFSEAGNAEVDAVVQLPSPCNAPAVFFTTSSNRWLAVTGF